MGPCTFPYKTGPMGSGGWAEACGHHDAHEALDKLKDPACGTAVTTQS